MRDFLLRRLLLMAPVLIGLSILIFTLSRAMPGDPVRLALGPEATQAQVEAMRHEMGLDVPLPLQYVRYVRGLLVGDWGESLKTNRNVLDDLRDFFPATFELTTLAMLIAILFGVPLGVISAIRRNKWQDQASMVLALSGVAFPQFWLGIMLQIVFAYIFHLLPPIGRMAVQPADITGMVLLDSLITLNGAALVDGLRHIILPAFALSLGTLAQITRLTRSNMISEMRKDYVLAGRAYGLPESIIVYKYMLKNAFTSTLTIIGLAYGFLLGNAFLVETVFSWPGMAQYAVQAVLFKDFNAIVGVTLVVGLAFAVINLVIDILYGYLDPRIKYS